jgi:hypothetical protein
MAQASSDGTRLQATSNVAEDGETCLQDSAAFLLGEEAATTEGRAIIIDLCLL